MIYSLVYVSSASGVYDKEIYRQIALVSEAHNSKHDITGMLLVYNETIIQFLEGEKAEVEALYQRIETDNRHINPFVMSRIERPNREFAQWSMGYQELVPETEPKFLFMLNAKSLLGCFPAITSATSIALLNGFKSSSGLVSRPN